MTTRKLVLSLGAAALLGGAGGAVATTGLDAGSTTSTTITQAADAPSSSGAVADTATTQALSAQQIYRRSKNAVAYITAKVTEQTSSPFGPQTSSGTATGSGFVISSDGLIVTNAHVIDGASSISVKVGDGAATTAKVIGTDTSTDIALLKVDTAGKKLATLTLGDSDTVQVGDATFAIGNPYGLDRTLTTGVVSAKQRTITAPDGYSISNVLQTDAALNPGNSGGPLLDAQGDVIGVNSQIESSSNDSGSPGGNTGVGFAVPSNTVKRVVQQLRDSGKATHAYLGASAGDATGSTNGAQIGSVTSGGPADDAGVQKGDVVTAIDATSVTSADELTAALDGHAAGDKVTLHVKRGSDSTSITVTLGTRPQGSTPAAQSQLPGSG